MPFSIDFVRTAVSEANMADFKDVKDNRVVQWLAHRSAASANLGSNPGK